MEESEKQETWWQYIYNKFTEQINPCLNYFYTHKLESFTLLLLTLMIIYQITYEPTHNMIIIQRGGVEEGGGESASPKKGLLSSAASRIGKGVTGLKNFAGNQFSSGISAPINEQLDKLAPFRENPGEKVRTYIYKILEMSVIVLVFFPCISLFIIILASYYMIKPKLKLIKAL